MHGIGQMSDVRQPCARYWASVRCGVTVCTVLGKCQMLGDRVHGFGQVSDVV